MNFFIIINIFKMLVKNDSVEYKDHFILSKYKYDTTIIDTTHTPIIATPLSTDYMFKTDKKIPTVGLMLVGFGGNNGSTLLGGIIANKENLSWKTKDGDFKANYYGSLFQTSTTKVGQTKDGKEVYLPMRNLLPMLNPNDLVISGWDINNMNLSDCLERSHVFDYNLQEKLKPLMKNITPLPGLYYPDFIASNQKHRANSILEGNNSSLEHLNKIRNDIKTFKTKNKLDKVIVLWTGNTERFCNIENGINDTEQNVMNALKNGHHEVAPSQVYAIASILENCAYINGSPMNTFVPGIIQMARRLNVFIGGNDFKSGQTKIKSVLVDFLVSSGIKPESIVSYNHLGNNDGQNLSEDKQFKSKEISKSNVIDDMVKSNNILYNDKKGPDHVVVIKYVPFVKDSKRAMDEYISSIFMGGKNTLVMHNTCEDSLLATPIMIDLILLTELMQRIEYKTNNMEKYEKMDSVLSILSFFLKAPLVKDNTPIINSFFKQRSAIENILKACIGLKPDNNMLLEHKIH